MTKRNIQNRLDAYRHWYNEYRPHSALGGRTPDEAWSSKRLPETVIHRARDEVSYAFDVRRLKCRGDPRLPVIRITRRAA